MEQELGLPGRQHPGSGTHGRAAWGKQQTASLGNVGLCAFRPSDLWGTTQLEGSIHEASICKNSPANTTPGPPPGFCSSIPSLLSL